MKDFLKGIATTNNWVFFYGRDDFENLYDGLDDTKVVMLLRPLQSSATFDDYGNEVATTWTGSFTLSMSSNFNEKDYEYRYDTYIKPITNAAFVNFKKAFKCHASYSLENVQTVEIVNSGDFNLDGLFVSFTISQI